MPVNRIQFQAGMSLSQFLEQYSTEVQREAALEQTRWPDGFRFPNAESRSMVLCMGVATGAISAGAAVIRQQSLQEESWKPPSP
jgi:hypothetical protein